MPGRSARDIHVVGIDEIVTVRWRARLLDAWDKRWTQYFARWHWGTKCSPSCRYAQARPTTLGKPRGQQAKAARPSRFATKPRWPSLSQRGTPD